jgi:hypothetical protein
VKLKGKLTKRKVRNAWCSGKINRAVATTVRKRLARVTCQTDAQTTRAQLCDMFGRPRKDFTRLGVLIMTVDLVCREVIRLCPRANFEDVRLAGGGSEHR